MKNNKGIALVTLVVVMIILLIMTGFIILFLINNNEIKLNNESISSQSVCEHEWVITSEFNWWLSSYKTFSKCSKCGKEIK